MQSVLTNLEQSGTSSPNDSEDVLQQLLGKHTAIILAQAADPKVQEIILKLNKKKDH